MVNSVRQKGNVSALDMSVRDAADDYEATRA
jgi:hypothetical protein